MLAKRNGHFRILTTFKHLVLQTLNNQKDRVQPNQGAIEA